MSFNILYNTNGKILLYNNIRIMYSSESSGATSDIVTDGLQLYLDASKSSSYPGSGSVWYDISGNGYDGTIYNAVYDSGSGGEFYFDGSGDYVSTGDIDVDYTTLCAWVKAETGARFVINKNYSSGVVPYSLTVEYGSLFSGMAFYDVSHFWPSSTITTNIINDNTWHYICGRYDGVNLEYWLDGTRDDYSAQSAGALPKNDYPTEIGRYASDGAYYKGYIGAVHIYNRALSSDEILSNYNNTKTRFGR